MGSAMRRSCFGFLEGLDEVAQIGIRHAGFIMIEN